MTAPVPPPADQHWPWWPLLPLYPYGRRPTLVRELIPGRIWSFEQLHGVWYVAVPIRMTVVRVEGGLLLYSPIPPTGEVLKTLHDLERRHGPVRSIVLATSSGLEHKLPLPALARAFPAATVWVSDHQWSFPLRLPDSWLGFPAGRTRVLGRDGYPYPDQFHWLPLGPLDLGVGTFLEVACLDRATGCLLLTDALVSIPLAPPDIFDLDPSPLLFHARERGSEPMIDTPTNRVRGWKRIVLFANFFQPAPVSVPALKDIFSDCLAAPERSWRTHFGLYPFRWSAEWEQQADQLIARGEGEPFLTLAPVLERLVFVRARRTYLEWLRKLGKQPGITSMVAAHYAAPLQLSCLAFEQLADRMKQRGWASSDGSWQLLASIDNTLIRLGVVPHDSPESLT
jgi:hypothetical protein